MTAFEIASSDYPTTIESGQCDIASIREGMIRHHQEVDRERRAKPPRRIHKPPDHALVLKWREQLNELIDAGIDDILLGYWRTSTRMQNAEDTYSPECQRKLLSAWGSATTERGVDLVVFDVDSGSTENRVGLDFVREAMASGKIKTVSCYRYDRMMRSVFLSELVHREAKQHGVAIVSITEAIEDSFTGVLFRSLLSAINQYESCVIKQRMTLAKAIAAEAGIYMGSIAPTGYRLAGDGLLEIQPEEASVVILIHYLYERGFSCDAVAGYLSRQRIPCKNASTKQWHPASVSDILQHERAYRSEWRFTQVYQNPDSKIIHSPILQHRADPTLRTYMYNNRKPLPFGSQVPDNYRDPPLNPVTERNDAIRTRRRKEAESKLAVRRQRVGTVLLLLQLREARMSVTVTAHTLNNLGLPSVRGRKWSHNNVLECCVNHAKWRAKADSLGVEAGEMPSMASEALKDYLSFVEMEASAVARIWELSAQGLRVGAICRILADEGYETVNHCRWHHEAIASVLRGTQRRSDKPIQAGRNDVVPP